MSVEKINPVYQANTKQDGDALPATEWNAITNAVNIALTKINEVIDNPSSGGGGGSTPSAPIDTSGVISVSNKGNVTLGSNKNINLESAYGANPEGYTGNWGDIALKPGDDIQFCSHHRAPKKRDKVVIKMIDNSDNPVKMQMVAGEMEFAVGTANNPKTATFKKDKTTGADTTDKLFKNSDAKVMDFKILTGNVLDEGTENERDERAYLKVRAQAIDLRCEKHGGIALQPKGYDSNGNMNKIKFEHGGGDGLEFGTFNTEKTSIFTDEYRFNKNGVWKMATRQKVASEKTIIDEGQVPAGKENTAAFKYVKQEDDFYDAIDDNDAQCTTEGLIKTASALNEGFYRQTSGNGDNIRILTNRGIVATYIGADDLSEVEIDNTTIFGIVLPDSHYWDEFKYDKSSGDVSTVNESQIYTILGVDNTSFAALVGKKISEFAEGETLNIVVKGGVDGTTILGGLSLVFGGAGAIKIESQGNVELKAREKLKLSGVLDFGSAFNFGETDEGIKYQYKATKKGKNKQCDVLQVEVFNNSSETVTFNEATHLASNSDKFTDENGTSVAENSVIPTFYKEGAVSIPAGETKVVAQCSIMDIIKLVSYMKSNQQGPWASNSQS